MQVDCKEFRDNFPLWTLIFPLAVVCCSAGKGEFRMISPSEPIVAASGDDVILPCHLDPPLNVETFVVEWSKPDFKPDPSDQNWVDIVLLYYDMKEAPEKIPSYVNRTQLFTEELRHGNVSLKILNVTSGDAGRYRCDILHIRKYSIVQLVVVEFRMNSSSEPVIAAPGDDVILPCRLDPASDAQNLTVQWSRPDLKPEPSGGQDDYIHLYRDGREDLDMKLPLYVNRTRLFTEELKHGNMSLKILNVTSGDAGRYRCDIPNFRKHSIVQLIVVTEVDQTRHRVWILPPVFFFFLVLIVIGYLVTQRQKAEGVADVISGPLSCVSLTACPGLMYQRCVSYVIFHANVQIYQK